MAFLRSIQLSGFLSLKVRNDPEPICQERNRFRPDCNFGPHVVGKQPHRGTLGFLSVTLLAL